MVPMNEKKYTILFVDDEENNLIAFKMLFSGNTILSPPLPDHKPWTCSGTKRSFDHNGPANAPDERTRFSANGPGISSRKPFR